MSELSFAAEMMHERIAPPGSAGSKAERILRAARMLNWKPSRVKTVWYGDERVSIKPRELRKIEEVSGVEYEGRQELGEVDQLIGRADALLMGRGPNSDRPVVAALRALVSALDRPGTGR